VANSFTGTTFSPTYMAPPTLNKPVTNPVAGGTQIATAPSRDRLTQAVMGASGTSPTNVSGIDISNPAQTWFGSIGQQPAPGADWWSAYNAGGFTSAPMKGDYGAITAPAGANAPPAGWDRKSPQTNISKQMAAKLTFPKAPMTGGRGSTGLGYEAQTQQAINAMRMQNTAGDQNSLWQKKYRD
jgi:hypothetical protein